MVWWMVVRRVDDRLVMVLLSTAFAEFVYTGSGSHLIYPFEFISAVE